MGNGANSRPENPVVMQPTRRLVPQASGFYASQPGYGSSDYVANGGDGRLQPHYGSHSQYSGDSALEMVGHHSIRVSTALAMVAMG